LLVEAALKSAQNVLCRIAKRLAKRYIPSMPTRGRGEQIPMFDATGAVAAPAKKPRKRRRGVALGRRPRAERVGFVPHATRENHDWRHPVHVSMRRVKHAPSLRSERIFQAIRAQLARVKRRGVHVVHYSVQHDHLHLIVEGQDRHDLSAQMRKLFSRIALAVNAIAKRRGSLFRDRHHRAELESPTKMRNALVYVLFNDRKHHAQNGGGISDEMLSELDDRSSAAWLNGWDERARPPPETIARLKARDGDIEDLGPPLVEPQTWLAQCGWRVRGRGGAIKLHELPRFL
jgi:REP element-mobilizing transposase RayT